MRTLLTLKVLGVCGEVLAPRSDLYERTDALLRVAGREDLRLVSTVLTFLPQLQPKTRHQQLVPGVPQVHLRIPDDVGLHR